MLPAAVDIGQPARGPHPVRLPPRRSWCRECAQQVANTYLIEHQRTHKHRANTARLDRLERREANALPQPGVPPLLGDLLLQPAVPPQQLAPPARQPIAQVIVPIAPPPQTLAQGVQPEILPAQPIVPPPQLIAWACTPEDHVVLTQAERQPAIPSTHMEEERKSTNSPNTSKNPFSSRMSSPTTAPIFSTKDVSTRSISPNSENESSSPKLKKASSSISTSEISWSSYKAVAESPSLHSEASSSSSSSSSNAGSPHYNAESARSNAHTPHSPFQICIVSNKNSANEISSGKISAGIRAGNPEANSSNVSTEKAPIEMTSINKAEPEQLPGPSIPNKIRKKKVAMCRYCNRNEVGCILYRCGHLCYCLTCGENLKNKNQGCPICLMPIRRVIEIHRR